MSSYLAGWPRRDCLAKKCKAVSSNATFFCNSRTSGEVPGLFSSEELAKELMPLEQRRNEDSNYTGPPTLYAYFIHRCE